MDRKVILAVAGSGKTYRICHDINPDKKNLLLAFTHENIANINRELLSLPCGMPRLTEVMTFDSFVYRYAICPFVGQMARLFKYEGVSPNGITIKTPPVCSFCDKAGNHRKNPNYHPVTCMEHFFDEKGRFYCALLCELIIRCGEPLIDKIAELVNCCFDTVAIDEFQDFRNYEFDFILRLTERLNKVTLVGDFFQHSVIPKKNFGRPYVMKNKSILEYSGFKEMLTNKGFVVDEESLSKSRRCSKRTCDFVRAKLGVPIESLELNPGEIRQLDDSEVDDVLANPSIQKLVYEEANRQVFSPCVNWSYSKGDTYSTTCVILTKRKEAQIMNHDFNVAKLSCVSRNTLYVALTRSKGNVYVVAHEQLERCHVFDRVRGKVANLPEFCARVNM